MYVPQPVPQKYVVGQQDPFVYMPAATSRIERDREHDRMGQMTLEGWTPLQRAYAAVSLVATGLGAYHGYKRNNSVGWAIWWGFASGVAPFFALPIAYAQGFAKRR